MVSSLRFEVRDERMGFTVDRPAGAGLADMRDRIEAMGGRLTIESVSGEGTCVTGVFRCADARAS